MPSDIRPGWAEDGVIAIDVQGLVELTLWYDDDYVTKVLQVDEFLSYMIFGTDIHIEARPAGETGALIKICKGGTVGDAYIAEAEESDCGHS